MEQLIEAKQIEISNRPDEVVDRYKDKILNVLDTQKQRRLRLKSEFEVKLTVLDAEYQERLDKINDQIRSLDEQLRQMRSLLLSTDDERKTVRSKELDEFARLDAAQLKIIHAQEAMIEVLRSS